VLPCEALAIVLQHLVIHSRVVAFDRQSWFRNLGLDNEVIVTPRAELVGFCVPFVGLLSEYLFALLAGEGQFSNLLQCMIFALGVAFGAVEPLFTFALS